MATQQELDNLAKLYLAARDRLLGVIVNHQGVGTKTYANTILQQLNRELAKLQAASDKFIETAIPAEYQKGLDEVYSYFKKTKLLMKHPSLFADLHTEAIYLVAREMQYQIQEGLAQVGRRVASYVDRAQDEVLRAAGLAATGEKLASGGTIVDMKQSLIRKLQTEGFMTVQYGQGPDAYQVSLDSYAMMCARSTTREAGNLARENQLTQNGYDLVQMTTHYPTCEVCAPLQGRVYSISGQDKRFPPLSKAFGRGYHNVHPNCRHSIVPWIESLKTKEELQAAIGRSNQPFKDTRGKAEVDLYKQQQNANRQARQDLYQYERYKARLGGEAPRSLHAFRTMKRAGGRAWGVMEAQYKGMGYYEQAIGNEPGVTAAVTSMADRLGVKAAGLEFRIKSKGSYLRKIADNYSEEGNEYEVKDILRYTFTTGPDALADRTLQSIDALAADGYDTIEIKNSWLSRSNPYKGINTVVRAPSGQKFELQYHTPESFALKDGELHRLYEQWRVIPNKASPEAAELTIRMQALSAQLQVPPGIEKVR